MTLKIRGAKSLPLWRQPKVTEGFAADKKYEEGNKLTQDRLSLFPNCEHRHLLAFPLVSRHYKTPGSDETSSLTRMLEMAKHSTNLL